MQVKKFQKVPVPKNLFLYVSLCYWLISISAGLSTNSYVHVVITHLIVLYAIIMTGRHLVLLSSAMAEHTEPGVTPVTPLPLVSIIVPAYNEEKVIEDALKGLAELNHQNFEIIVISDGCTDDTEGIVREFIAQNQHVEVRLISQSNAGKSSALNTGIVHAMGDYILCVDADSRLAADALDNVFHHFNDPEVGAVGGFIAVRNSPSLISRFQELEYQLSLNFTRKAFSLFGAVTIIPGPIGLFRREALQDVGGYREDRSVFAEDADLTVRMLAAGWKVKGESSMVSATEVPNTTSSLLRQRYRWKRGIFQAFYDNFYSLVTANSYRCVLIGLYLAMETVLLPVVNFGLALYLVINFLQTGVIELLLTFYLLLFLLDLLTLFYAFGCRWCNLRWIGIMIIDKFSYSCLLQIWGVLSLIDEWRSTKMTWDKLERVGQAS